MNLDSALLLGCISLLGAGVVPFLFKRIEMQHKEQCQQYERELRRERERGDEWKKLALAAVGTAREVAITARGAP